eukprot:4509249-Pleurochrysis_carterae.AAC.1
MGVVDERVPAGNPQQGEAATATGSSSSAAAAAAAAAAADKGTGAIDTLPLVASLLRCLRVSERCRVIASCAHKTEPCRLARLFSACGSPVSLVAESLACGDVDGAALLLMPVLLLLSPAAC